MVSNVKCLIDRDVVNKDTIANMTDLGISFFAPLCGRNRGAFVLDPPDGQTYGCVAFPPNYADLAGVDTEVTLEDSNDINEQFLAGNITASDAVELLDFFVKAVYDSSSDVQAKPYGCDAGGLAKLDCGEFPLPSILPSGGPIRAATVAGVFVPAPWMGAKEMLTLNEAKNFYSAKDFHDMKKLGLNAVQVPVFTSTFEDGSEDIKNTIGELLDLVDDAGLSAILVLTESDDTTDEKKAVTNAAVFVSEKNAAVALTLPSADTALVDAARKVVATLPLLIPIKEDKLQGLYSDDSNIYAALELPHSTTVGDVASSTSQDDRMKLFYHESVSCISRSPIEYASCFKKVPVFISNGFDLAIDDCATKESKAFKNYGQCDRFDETIDSNWWHNHRSSFAARQIFAYEHGLGWSFATWKLYDEDDDKPGMIDSPAKLLSLKDVAAAGLLPPLAHKHPATLACLNPPESDFVLGDDTLSPTPSPPPDCGNGWWNFTTAQCDFWIPPPPPPPCLPVTTTSPKELGLAAISGAVIGVILLKVLGDKRDGYSRIP